MLRQIARLVVESILAAEEGVTASQVAARTGSPEPLVASVLRELSRQGLVEEAGGVYVAADKLELALYAVRIGVDPMNAARSLDWRLFEKMVAEALSMAGYRVVRGLRLKPPGGLEVDVLGIGPLYSPVIDCKHWSPGYSKRAKLREAAEKHAGRLRRLAARWGETGLPSATLTPAIVTLTDPGLRLVEGVAVVPVSVMADFIEDLPRYVEELGLIRVEASAKQ